jgi:hypothetical protein
MPLGTCEKGAGMVGHCGKDDDNFVSNNIDWQLECTKNVIEIQ